MLTKSAHWQTTAVQNSARTVYTEDSSPEPTYRQNKKSLLTGTKFRETLPLITTNGDRQSSKKDQLGTTIQEEMHSVFLEEDSKQATTFEDYRHNM